MTPAVQAPRPARRVSGFVGRLRANGFAVGPAESAAALDLLNRLGPPDAKAARLGLKALLCGRREDWERFDEIFEAYWYGRERAVLRPSTRPRAGRKQPAVWDSHLPPDTVSAAGPAGGPAELLAESEGDGEGRAAGRLLASARESLGRTDLRRLVEPQAVAEAEQLAERLARAIVYRLSRRYRAARRGASVDLRRTIRRNLARGGEPIDLVARRRPNRPVRLVVLLDVSGSMQPYSRFFLLFLRGLLSRWLRTEAFLFHTRLLRISEVFRDRDALRALSRLSLMAEGFGGGTRIGACLGTFNDRYAAEMIDSRTVVVIMSDGYDTDEPARLAEELRRLKTRARRLVWLNPLLGWRDYAPVARGMAAALPYIDCFAAAHTLDELAALEGELARL